MSVWFSKFLRFAYLEHLHHLILVAKEQDASVFARNTLNLGDDRLNDRSFVYIVPATTTFPPAAIQTVCLRALSRRWEGTFVEYLPHR